MIRHWFRLLWSRRRHNTAIVVEIATCFLVLCAVAALGLHQLDKARIPTGYTIDDVYAVYVDYGSFYSMNDDERAATRTQMATLLDATRMQPQVEAAAVASNVPYLQSRWMSGIQFDGQRIKYIVGTATLELRDVLGLEITEGRWFDERDQTAGPDNPVIISRSLARIFFGDESPIGKLVPRQDDDGNPVVREPGDPADRIIGVVDDYRWLGEYAPLHHTQFRFTDLRGGIGDLSPFLLVRTAPGAGTDFEERLLGSMRATAPAWEFRLRLLADYREQLHAQQLRLPIVGIVLAGFLVLMVGLGLVGVLWQSVAQRTSEFGLRRALGSAASGVRSLVLGELMALATISALIGGLIFVQAPLLGIVTGLSTSVWIGAIALAAVVLYSFVLICGLYPSWLATRIEPARALQYE